MVALWLQETRLVGGAIVDGETGGVDDNTTGDGVLPEGVCDGVLCMLTKCGMIILGGICQILGERCV